MTETRTYDDAVTCLNTLQSSPTEMQRRGLRPPTLRSVEDRNASIHKMRRCLQILGCNIDDLKIVHVAGSKGKGSVCTYISVLLEGSGAFSKVGLYSSPHVTQVRERIAINRKPISKTLFAKYFFEVWDILYPDGKDERQKVPIHGYFLILTLLATYVYVNEGVDIAIYEVGVGGEYDVTNVISRPLATAITPIHLEHVAKLGYTLAEIAWHKAGIQKYGCPSFTSEQHPDAAGVLRKRAAERGTVVSFVHMDERLKGANFRVRYQKENASLAIAVYQQVIKTLFAQDLFDMKVIQNLEDAELRGRASKLIDTLRMTWYLDSAHTVESVVLATTWFVEASKARPNAVRVLLFNQQSLKRDAAKLLDAILKHNWFDFFQKVVLCPTLLAMPPPDLINENNDSASLKRMELQKQLAQHLRHQSVIATLESNVDEAVNRIRDSFAGNETQILVVGSLHLVGAVLYVIEADKS